MFNESLERVREAIRTGRYSDALIYVKQASASSRAESAERRCLTCEVNQFQGEFGQALTEAEQALSGELSPHYAARYWCVVGRVRLDQQRREDAAEALRKALRFAEKADHLETRAVIQQLLLIAAAENLGAGLTPAVREAYATAVRTADASVLGGFHLRVGRLEAQRGAFPQSLHHLSLAKSLLGRSDHVAYSALLHVNKACVFTLLGKFSEARKEAELGAALADKAGQVRLSMAAAATVAHAAISTGDLSVAASWLATAKKLVCKLDVTEVGLLESLASMALLQGDLDLAEQHLQEVRNLFDSQGIRWTTAGAYCLLTEAFLHKKRGNKKEQSRVLALVRAISDSQGDSHSGLLATLAEAESLFDEREDAAASQKIAWCLQQSPLQAMHLAELDRLTARQLWIEGRTASANRRLLRASAIAARNGTRWKWTEALNELRSMRLQHEAESAYSVSEQGKRADKRFPSLTVGVAPTWFETVAPARILGRDAVDGFTDATGILDLSPEPELRGREALASAIDLNVCERGALIAHGPSGLTIVAQHKLPKLNAVLKDPAFIRIEVGKVDGKTLELVLQPRKDLRSLFALAGIRRLLEAATAIEAQKKDQQRLGSLWQPEDIVEEPGAIFCSPPMIELMLTARKVAATRLPVLLLGPTGTGKEILAKAIHRASPRANKFLLAFNCSAVPRDMVESQLFGYRRGAFTGATDDFPGIIRSAEGGTLFLDEIGELCIDLQPKLLRFLETNEVHPLGEGRPIKVDVRVIAATNANLEDLIDKKQFREDLYYRLNIVRFHMPRLRERREEIPPLVTHLIRQCELDENKQGIKVSDELIEYLLLYAWPGNIRQLANEIRRMVAMVASNETLTAEHLTPAIRATRRTVPVADDAGTTGPAPAPEAAAAGSLTVALEQPLPGAVEALERAMIEHAIERAQGRLEEAARLLGISRKGLFLKRRRWMGSDTPSSDV